VETAPEISREKRNDIDDCPAQRKHSDFPQVYNCNPCLYLPFYHAILQYKREKVSSNFIESLFLKIEIYDAGNVDNDNWAVIDVSSHHIEQSFPLSLIKKYQDVFDLRS
jgi:hypothetical protein